MRVHISVTEAMRESWDALVEAATQQGATADPTLTMELDGDRVALLVTVETGRDEGNEMMPLVAGETVEGIGIALMDRVAARLRRSE